MRQESARVRTQLSLHESDFLQVQTTVSLFEQTVSDWAIFSVYFQRVTLVKMVTISQFSTISCVFLETR